MADKILTFEYAYNNMLVDSITTFSSSKKSMTTLEFKNLFTQYNTSY